MEIWKNLSCEEMRCKAEGQIDDVFLSVCKAPSTFLSFEGSVSALFMCGLITDLEYHFLYRAMTKVVFDN